MLIRRLLYKECKFNTKLKMRCKNFIQHYLTSVKNDIKNSNATDELPESYQTQASVYIHWPYCKQRCTYCNFVKYVPRENTSWTLPENMIIDTMVSSYI